MPLLHTLPGRTALIDGEEWLYASGTSYLGMVKDEEFRALLMEGFDRYGMHYGGSRLAAIQIDIFKQAEQFLAELTGASAAVVVSSGTLAGQLAAYALRGVDRQLMAPETHPALWGDVRPKEESRKAWIQRVISEAGRWEGGIALYSNAVDGMRARAYDFSWLSELPLEIPLSLVVDESHTIGVLGPEGGGSYRALKAYAPQLRVVVSGSLGKAFGIPAGFVAGDVELITAIRSSPFFGGAAPPSPAWLYAMVRATDCYANARARLRERLRQFRRALQYRSEFRFLTNFPVVYCANPGLSDALARERILISSFPYPTADDPPVQRIVLNALHTPEDVDRLTAALFNR